MVKKKRKYNPNLIKARHCYSIAEICEVYHKHPRTVQSWRRLGLKPIDEASKPYLFMGEEIRHFLKEKRQKSRRPLKAGEFFCPKCKSARKSIPDKLLTIITDKKLGKDTKQAFIRGVCQICKTSLIRFSSDKRINEFPNDNMLLTEHKANVMGNEDSSSIADIKGG